jgi:hypothetical protein
MATPTTTWPATAVGPSTQGCQHAYVNARAHEINRLGDKARTATIALFGTDPILGARLKGYSGSKKDAFCADAYDRLTRDLQSRELTINFEADKWFSSENNYTSYTQMYERAIAASDNKMLLKDDAAKGNFAEFRAAADDRITIPSQWAAVPLPQRGLAPAPQRIAERLMTGGKFVPKEKTMNVGNLTPVTAPDGSIAGYHSPNAKFDPKAKQVFSALNYGRRPRGSNIYYGKSYIVLDSQFKKDALYYSGDTFAIDSPGVQVTYQTLGSIFEKSTPHMRKLLVESCFDGHRLGDTDKPDELMEAHIFQPLLFAGGLSAMYIDSSSANIVDNAKKFARKWKITLTLAGGVEFKGR